MAFGEILLQLSVLPGVECVAAIHAEELPQKDELCGPFWGAIALRAAGIVALGDELVDQDAVAQRAGTILSGAPELSLPGCEEGRRDFRINLPVTAETSKSGSSAAGISRAIEALSAGALRVLPYTGDWTVEKVSGLLDRLINIGTRVTVIANLFAGDLWEFRPAPREYLAYLRCGGGEMAPSRWDVGHFVGVAGTLRGTGGSLVMIADSYRSLGWHGWHLQPVERVAAALRRSDGREGGMLIVAPASGADEIIASIAGIGLEHAHWSNGTDARDT